MLDRVRTGPEGPQIGGVPPAEILDSLEGGEAPDRLAARLGVKPIDILAAIAVAGLGVGEDAQGPPLATSNPPRPRLAGAVSDRALAALLPDAPVLARLNIRAGLCQALDFWESSHQAAQEADDRGEKEFSAYWHGIAHRREPDPGNASYWFRRVGRHPLFASLARASTPLLAGPTGSSMADRLIRGGSWDPFAFIEACTRSRPGTAEAALARKLQRLEMGKLLEATIAGAIAP
ncbi:MAG: hypothetical protein U0800_02960 [Isosphaeraceae bacterium]